MEYFSEYFEMLMYKNQILQRFISYKKSAKLNTFKNYQICIQKVANYAIIYIILYLIKFIWKNKTPCLHQELW